MLTVGWVLLVEEEGQGQTKMVQGHVVTTQEWVSEGVAYSMGLVPGFTSYPSLMTVESERVGVVVVVREGVTRMSVDKDVVEGEMDVGSGHCHE